MPEHEYNDRTRWDEMDLRRVLPMEVQYLMHTTSLSQHGQTACNCKQHTQHDKLTACPTSTGDLVSACNVAQCTVQVHVHTGIFPYMSWEVLNNNTSNLTSKG